MKTKRIVVCLFAITLLAGGCAATRPGFAPERSIPVEIRSTSPITVLKAQAVRADGRVLVRGALRRPATTPMPSHVDVLFRGPDGSPIYEHRIEVAGLHSRRVGVQEVPFSAVLELELPAGARALFSYHAPPL
jgi:hypothetical protein